MQLTVNINDPAEINAAIAILNKLLPAEQRDATRRPSGMPVGVAAVDDPSVGADPTPAPVTEAPKRGRPRKTEPAQEVAAEPVGKSQEDSGSAPTTDSSTTATTYTLDDIRNALKTYTSKHGMDAGIALLKSFEAQRVSELAAEKYAEFVAKAGV